jgi:hypothetical protein
LKINNYLKNEAEIKPEFVGKKEQMASEGLGCWVESGGVLLLARD